MKDVPDRHRTVKMNEVRGRFISALRQYNLTGAEFRIVIALNDLYNPKFFKAWPSQDYLCEALRMPERTLRQGTRGLEKKGIVETKEVRLSREHSRLEYRLAYDRVIGCDPGYPKSRDRGPIKGIQMMLMSPAVPCPLPAIPCRSTGNLLPPYRQRIAANLP
jgi:helix-turn-helix protein